MSIYDTIAEEANKIGIGNTPLIKLGNNIYAKLEYCNRFHSIKDRASFFMIDYALRTGKLTKDKIIIEASSGNTGIAIAGIASFFGIKSKIIIPENSAPGTVNELINLGADVIKTPGNSTEESINYMQSIINENPDLYYNPFQHMNKLNSDAHYYGTAPEIYNKIKNIDNIVVGIGTGGTITGLARYFKEKSPDTVITGIIPDENSHIYGLRNPFKSTYKGLIDNYSKYIDNIITVSENDAYSGVSELENNYNLLCWPFIWS